MKKRYMTGRQGGRIRTREDSAIGVIQDVKKNVKITDGMGQMQVRMILDKPRKKGAPGPLGAKKRGKLWKTGTTMLMIASAQK